MKGSILRLGLAVGGMLVSFGAFAGAGSCGSVTTVSQWASVGSCVDPVDGDMLFTFGSSTVSADPGFSVTDTVADGSYRIVFDFGLNGYSGGGSITYTMTSLNSESLAAVTLSTDVGTPSPAFPVLFIAEGPSATKSLFNVGGGPAFLTVTSVNGVTSPTMSFGPLAAVTVTDSFFNTATESVEGIFTAPTVFFNATNKFDTVTVPEPASIALLGLGLAGLAAVRRRCK